MKSQSSGQAWGSLASPEDLRRIDRLREKNFKTGLPLPQLVAVGDQSSGKSSLLENLTGIPFPNGQELCTRFATQITQRREDSTSIKISIISGSRSSSDDKERREPQVIREMKSTAQLRAEYSEMLDEVNKIMGIRTANNPSGDKTFTEDVLKIEKCGPNEDYLTVIDVPGIFRATTEGVTTPKDRDLVKNMVKQYIQNERTIILAVLPANVDVATQEILDLAEKYDKTGERTLGILTKPDLATENSRKMAVCNLVKGHRHPLKLGYYVVRNRGGDDTDDAADAGATHQREELFREQPWCELPDDRLGIAALRKRLQELLGQIYVRALPKLRAEARQRLAAAQKSLLGLGPPRHKVSEQRQYLAEIAGNFQSLVRAALNADYSAHDSLESEELRLITTVVNLSDEFSAAFDRRSQSYWFRTDSIPTGDKNVEPDQASSSSVDGDDSDSGSSVERSRLNNDVSPGELSDEEFPDLEQIVTKHWTATLPKEGIMGWIESLYYRSRGAELGTIGPGLLSSAFREQAKKWTPMTKQYLSQIIVAIHRFIIGALTAVCEDQRVYDELQSTVMPDLLAKYQDGMNRAMFLVEIERDARPYTLNHYFNNNVQRSRDRKKSPVVVRNSGKPSWDTLVVGEQHHSLDDTRSVVTDKSNAEHIKGEIHDILEAYYKVARKRFVDNVYLQAVDHVLLSGPDSPLSLFSQQWVIQLDTPKLAAIAGELRSTRDQRESLTLQIQDWEEVIETLR